VRCAHEHMARRLRTAAGRHPGQKVLHAHQRRRRRQAPGRGQPLPHPRPTLERPAIRIHCRIVPRSQVTLDRSTPLESGSDDPSFPSVTAAARSLSARPALLPSPYPHPPLPHPTPSLLSSPPPTLSCHSFLAFIPVTSPPRPLPRHPSRPSRPLPEKLPPSLLKSHCRSSAAARAPGLHDGGRLTSMTPRRPIPHRAVMTADGAIPPTPSSAHSADGGLGCSRRVRLFGAGGGGRPSRSSGA
jgi:hypothetical protein